MRRKGDITRAHDQSCGNEEIRVFYVNLNNWDDDAGEESRPTNVPADP